jgi:hypothetical protein
MNLRRFMSRCESSSNLSTMNTSPLAAFEIRVHLGNVAGEQLDWGRAVNCVERMGFDRIDKSD